MHRTRALILIALALALGLAVAACGGGGDDGGEDPQQVLEDTFNNEQSIDSGSFDLSLKVEAEGDQGGTFEGSLGGPFQSREAKFPQFDLNAEIKLDTSAQDFSGSAGLTSTGEGVFVGFQDTDYEVPQELFDQFSTSYEQLQQQSQSQGDQDSNFLQSLGIDPTNWLTDLSNEGSEDVDGTETVHISGTGRCPEAGRGHQEDRRERPGRRSAGHPPAARSARSADQRHQVGRLRHLQRRERQPAPQARREPRADAPRGHRRGARLGHPRGLADDQRRQRASDDLGSLRRPAAGEPSAAVRDRSQPARWRPPRRPRRRRRPAPVGRLADGAQRRRLAGLPAVPAAGPGRGRSCRSAQSCCSRPRRLPALMEASQPPRPPAGRPSLTPSFFFTPHGLAVPARPLHSARGRARAGACRRRD